MPEVSSWELIGAWVAVGLTLSLYTFLYKDNPFFKVAEHLYVGVSVGYVVVVTYYQFLRPKLLLPMVGEEPWPEGLGNQLWVLPARLNHSLFEQNNWHVLIPALLGVMLLCRFIPRIEWLSRWTFAFVMGFTAGTVIPRTISQRVLIQVDQTLKPLISGDSAQGVQFTFNDFSFFIIFLGVLSTLIHFYYSVEHRGPIRAAARVGVVFLMISFGASFGYTAMARMSLLYGRTKDLIEFSKVQYGYATIVMLGLIVLGLLVWERWRLSQPPEGPNL